jgi:hypothetical protein
VPRAAHHLVTFRPGQGWDWRAGRLIWVIAFRQVVLLNNIALPDCAATVPTACCGWNLTCWAMPTGWRRRGLAQWEKVRPGIRARGLPDLAVAALAKLPRCAP